MVDEYTHVCLNICIAPKIKAVDVIDALSGIFILAHSWLYPFRQRPEVHRPGCPGLDLPQFVQNQLILRRVVIGRAATLKALHRLYDELLYGKVVNTLQEVRIVIEARAWHYTRSSLRIGR